MKNSLQINKFSNSMDLWVLSILSRVNVFSIKERIKNILQIGKIKNKPSEKIKKNKASENISQETNAIWKTYQFNRFSCDLLGSMHHIFGLSDIKKTPHCCILYWVSTQHKWLYSLNMMNRWHGVYHLVELVYSVDLVVWSQSMMSTCPG